MWEVYDIEKSEGFEKHGSRENAARSAEHWNHYARRYLYAIRLIPASDIW